MTKRANAFLICLLASGCAAEVAGPEDGFTVLPGDMDDAESASKGDAWNYQNDPARLATTLNYRLEELPRTGRTHKAVWADTYWPTYEGSTNVRWRGPSVLSPMEKYDAAFRGWTPDARFAQSVPRDCGPDAHVRFEEYRATLGPAAKWQTTAQGRGVMFDGRDNDNDGTADECGGSDFDGIATWWGYCPGWSAAAILQPEPLHAVTHNGQTFEVSDIKALLVGRYEGANARMLGGRCNLKEVTRDSTGRITATECRDTNAGAFHVIITNFLGLNDQPFVEDRTGSSEVWNQPVVGFQIHSQDEITVARAHELLAVTGDAYKYNRQAVKLVEVRMTTEYVTEGHPSTESLGFEDYIRTDNYHYILELDARGKIIGGEWLDSSRDVHPDFLWLPSAASTSTAGGRFNPNVSLADIETLLRLSRAEETPVVGTTFENETAVTIPDNDRTGVSSTILVDRDFQAQRVAVAVEIRHTYRGDLRVELRHGGRTVVLSNLEGGNAHDLRKTFTFTEFAGIPERGEWTLFVNDQAAQDTGSIEKFSITFAR